MLPAHQKSADNHKSTLISTITVILAIILFSFPPYQLKPYQIEYNWFQTLRLGLQPTPKMTSKSPDANPPITPDPSQSGSPIRFAFLLEATLNLFTLPLITHPRPTLSLLLANPSHITPATILFARFFGGIVVFGLTSALLIGATNTRNGIESRRPTYVLLGLGEAALIPVLLAELGKGRGEAALSTGMAWGGVACLVPTALWRVYVLGFRPGLLGKYWEGGEKRVKGAKSE